MHNNEQKEDIKEGEWRLHNKARARREEAWRGAETDKKKSEKQGGNKSIKGNVVRRWENEKKTDIENIQR